MHTQGAKNGKYSDGQQNERIECARCKKINFLVNRI